MSNTKLSRTAAAMGLLLLAGAAAAHTGHGHDGLAFMAGVRHALGAPDHLLMLAFGFGFSALAAPRVLRTLRRAWAALRARRPATRQELA